MSDSPQTLGSRGDEWLRELYPPPDDAYAWRPLVRPSRWDAWGRNLAFFLITVASVIFTGGLDGTGDDWRVDVPRGLTLVLGLMPILIAHEMGHYVACLRYRVDATLPYFIPLPVLSFVGTLGAFIRIRGPIPNRKALFDIGIAGPLAGFLVCLPVLVLGALEAGVAPAGPGDGPLTLGVPPLYGWIFDWLRTEPPPGHLFQMGPLGMAAWFGLFVTALNLMPVGQLDGGHVVYALLRKHSLVVSRLALVGCFGLLYLRPTWLLWCVLLAIFGRSHPRTLDDHAPIGWVRIAIGVLGLLVFLVSFTPSPVIVTWADFRSAVWALLTAVASLFTSG